MLELFELAFMQRALLVSVMVAVICPAIGLVLVLRRLAQFGDTLAHVSLAGVAAGLMTRVYPVLTALIFAVAASLGIDLLRKTYRRYSELSVAITLSASLALAVVLLSMARGNGGEVMGYLFGSVMTVTSMDIFLIAGLGSLVFLLLLAIYKELVAVTFDEDLAKLGGLPVGLINTLFIAMTAITVAITMRVVGVLLVSSLMVVPVATALQLARSFRGALILSIGAGVISVVTGLLFAYGLDLAPGGTMVLSAVALLAVVIAVKRLAGLE